MDTLIYELNISNCLVYIGIIFVTLEFNIYISVNIMADSNILSEISESFPSEKIQAGPSSAPDRQTGLAGKAVLPGDNSPARASGTSVIETPVLGAITLGDLQKGQAEQMALMQNLMEQFTQVKADVVQLKDRVSEYDDVSDDDYVPNDNDTNGNTASVSGTSVSSQKQPEPATPSSGILGEIESTLALEEPMGAPISKELASLADKLLKVKLEDKRRAELYDKYLVPENLDIIVAPKVNREIWRILYAKTRSADIRIQKVQQSNLKALVPLLRVIDSLVAGRDNPASLNVEEMIKQLVDAVVLASAGNADTNVLRRDTIKQDMDEEYQQMCSNTNPVTSLLFGDNISEQCKNITETNKIGLQVRGKKKNRFTPYNKDRSYNGDNTGRRSGHFLGQRTSGRNLHKKGRGRPFQSGHQPSHHQQSGPYRRYQQKR